MKEVEDKFTVIIPSKTLCPLTYQCVNEIRKFHSNIRIIIILDTPTTSKVEAEIIVTPNLNIGEKRNRGVALTQTPYIAFIDSDAIPAPGWPENGLTLLERDQIGIVTGPNLPPPNQNDQQELVYLASLTFLVSGSSRHEKADIFEGFVSKAAGHNLLISKELYQGVGGMNPQLKTGEDLDLSLKVLRAGKKIYFSRKTKVFHRNRMFRGFMRQRVVYGFSCISLIRNTSSYHYTTFPFLFQFMLLIGLSLSLLSAWFFILTLSVACLFILTILYESLRLECSFQKKLRLTSYIFIGNFFAGLGTWLYLIRPNYNIYNIYNNSE